MRRKKTTKRDVNPDPKYNDEKLAKFINNIMRKGKKSVAQRIVYNTLEIIKSKTKTEKPLEIFNKAIENASPLLEVKTRRVGGAHYQVPHEVRGERQEILAMRWLIETAKKKAQQTSRVTDEIVEQSKELLDALGVPYVQAPSEGESQASYMVKKGDAYAVGSQDFDCLLFGSLLLIRNLTSSGRRKLPNKKAYVKVTPELIRLKPGLSSLNISQKQLIDMAILIGTDFNEGIKGYGPKKSLNLIKKADRKSVV